MFRTKGLSSKQVRSFSNGKVGLRFRLEHFQDLTRDLQLLAIIALRKAAFQTQSVIVTDLS